MRIGGRYPTTWPLVTELEGIRGVDHSGKGGCMYMFVCAMSHGYVAELSIQV